MSVVRLSAGGVSFRHRSCVAGHGPGIRVVTYIYIYIYIKRESCVLRGQTVREKGERRRRREKKEIRRKIERSWRK